jgi:hypothetical protein
LTNCASGYGLVNDNGDCYFKGDGANDAAVAEDVVEINSVATVSLELWVWQNVLYQTDFLFRKHKDSTHSFGIMTSTVESMYFINQNGSAVLGRLHDYGNFITAETWHHIMMIINGNLTGDANRLKVFIDSAQMSLTFEGGAVPATTADLSGESIYIGGQSSGSGSLDGRIALCNIYSDADTSRPATNFAMGRDMGLMGVSIEDEMKLMKNMCCIRKRRGIV